jgi:hypothetical protein
VLVLPLYLLHQSENHCFKQTFHVIYSHVIIGSTFIYVFFCWKCLVSWMQTTWPCLIANI